MIRSTAGTRTRTRTRTRAWAPREAWSGYPWAPREARSGYTSRERPLRARVPVLVAAVLALGLAGCAKKITQVDSSYDAPEGTPTGQARLLVRPDIPIEYIEYFDRLNVGAPTPVDTLFYTPYNTLASGHVKVGEFTLYESGPGAVSDLIVDSTAASTYQVLRRESGGGFRVAHDYVLNPKRRWLDTGWEGYAFTDPIPSSYRPPTYLGRGLFSDQVTLTSPLTNLGVVTSNFVDTLRFNYQDQIELRDLPDSTYTPPDSIFGLHWAQVAGADGYWLQIYQFTGNASEQIQSSLPAALYLDKSHDFFVGFVPAPADSYRLGEPGAIILSRRTIVNHQDYFARITAVDASGQLLAHSYGRPTRVPAAVRNTWDVFWRGAILIRPGPKVETGPGP